MMGPPPFSLQEFEILQTLIPFFLNCQVEKGFKIPIVFAKKSFDRRMKGKYIWNLVDHGFLTKGLGEEPNKLKGKELVYLKCPVISRARKKSGLLASFQQKFGQLISR